MGFERSVYTISESDGVLEVCVIVVQPLNLRMTNDTFVTIEFMTRDGSAIGKATNNIYNNKNCSFYIKIIFLPGGSSMLVTAYIMWVKI